jgi:hypothetical protein
MESLPNYDKWKLKSPYESKEDSLPFKPFNPFSDKIGEIISFWIRFKPKGKKMVLGVIDKTDNFSVTLNYCGKKTQYFLEDILFENNYD